MLKNWTNVQKFSLLRDLMPEICAEVKGDLKKDHLKADIGFVKRHFTGKNIQKLTVEDLVAGYSNEIIDSAREDLGEFVANRWLLKNTDLYDLFAEQLGKITQDFDKLEEIAVADAQAMVKSSVEEFGAVRTYLFSVLNSVVFPKSVFDDLAVKAKAEVVAKAKAAVEIEADRSVEAIERRLTTELARTTDRYEKKLAGMEKKYLLDVAALKKQVSTLQRKLDGVKA